MVAGVTCASGRCSPGSAGSTSDLSALAVALFGSAKATRSADASSPPIGPTSPATPTSPDSPATRSSPSTCSAADSPARASAGPTPAASGSSIRARVFGQSSPASLANYDPDTSSWRTSQLSLLGGFGEFSETWPRSGMTRNGTAYQLPPLAPLTRGTASGLLPTPAASEYGSSQDGINGKGGWLERPSAGTPSLSTMARKGLWPTPTTQDAENDGGPAQLTRRSLPLNAAAKTWRTPSASDASGGPMNPQDRLDQGHTLNLKEQVWVGGGGGSLNPTWVEWLMGFPPGWTDLEASATRSSRRSPSGSAGGS